MQAPKALLLWTEQLCTTPNSFVEAKSPSEWGHGEKWSHESGLLCRECVRRRHERNGLFPGGQSSWLEHSIQSICVTSWS